MREHYCDEVYQAQRFVAVGAGLSHFVGCAGLGGWPHYAEGLRTHYQVHLAHLGELAGEEHRRDLRVGHQGCVLHLVIVMLQVGGAELKLCRSGEGERVDSALDAVLSLDARFARVEQVLVVAAKRGLSVDLQLPSPDPFRDRSPAGREEGCS